MHTQTGFKISESISYDLTNIIRLSATSASLH